MTDDATPAKVRLTDGLGPLPEVGYLGDDVSYGYDALDMREYAAAEVARAVAAERERCKNLADLAVDYAKDADWSRVDAALGLL